MHNPTSGGSGKGISAENMARLLLRLDPDPLSAWTKYWDIWCRLAKYFEWNHCPAPEDLADEVMDRVAAKPDTQEIRNVDKYLFGVASFVCLEARHRVRRETPMEDLPGGASSLPDPHNQSPDQIDRLYQERRTECLMRCLAKLGPGDRELVIQYYSAEEEKQKTFRRKLAEKTGLTLDALRVRCSRLRAQLEPCVKRCLESRRDSGWFQAESKSPI